MKPPLKAATRSPKASLGMMPGRWSAGTLSDAGSCVPAIMCRSRRRRSTATTATAANPRLGSGWTTAFTITGGPPGPLSLTAIQVPSPVGRDGGDGRRERGRREALRVGGRGGGRGAARRHGDGDGLLGGRGAGTRGLPELDGLGVLVAPAVVAVLQVVGDVLGPGDGPGPEHGARAVGEGGAEPGDLVDGHPRGRHPHHHQHAGPEERAPAPRGLLLGRRRRRQSVLTLTDRAGSSQGTARFRSLDRVTLPPGRAIPAGEERTTRSRSGPWCGGRP